ncbi:MAG: twin-arginine translocase TatA/TatE family subunit [Planctomycetota bacterium]
MIGPWQVIIVLLIVLLLFGTRLPSLARSMGLSITEFKKGMKEIDEEPKSPDA